MSSARFRLCGLAPLRLHQQPAARRQGRLAAGFPGTFEGVFEGRHHAIVRFRQNYPRHARVGAAAPLTTYPVPVTIEGIFATGRNDPLWSIVSSPIPQTSHN